MRAEFTISCAIFFAVGVQSAKALDWDALSASVSVVSDARFRGVSQSAGHPVPQLEIDLGAGDGWSLGAFASEVDFRDHENTSIETDFYGVKEFDFGDTQLSVQAYYYAYPNHHPSVGGSNYSSVEGIANVSRSFGDLSATASVALSPDYSDESGPSVYASAGASYNITPYLAASANVGRLWVREWDQLPESGYPYTHWDVGATLTLKQVSFDLRLVGTWLSQAQCTFAEGGGNWCDTALIATASYTISVSASQE